MDTKNILRFKIQPVNEVQYRTEIEKVCGDIIAVESGFYSDGLTWFLVQDLRDMHSGFMCYYTPPGYQCGSEEERQKYEATDFHNMDEVHGHILNYARALASRPMKGWSGIYGDAFNYESMEELNGTGFECVEAL